METNNNYNETTINNYDDGSNYSEHKNKYRYLTAKTQKKITISISLCSLLVPESELIFIYLFGEVFFLAGLFVGLNFPVIGLLFLLTHGGSGLLIMIVSFLGGFDNKVLDFKRFFDNPVFSDGGIPSDFKLYFGAMITIFIII